MSTVPNMPTVTDVLPTGISRLEVNAVVVTTVLTVLGTLLAILRFCIRRKEALGVDDYILMVALVFLQLQLAFCYMSMFFPLRLGNATQFLDTYTIVKLAFSAVRVGKCKILLHAQTELHGS